MILRSLFFKESQDRMAREAVIICLRVLKESNKSRFGSSKVRNKVLIISHITFRDCCVHIFSDNLSQNSCMFKSNPQALANPSRSIPTHALLNFFFLKIEETWTFMNISQAEISCGKKEMSQNVL